jgi:hypothetical protein
MPQCCFIISSAVNHNEAKPRLNASEQPRSLIKLD